jgi:hypothetical protein
MRHSKSGVVFTFQHTTTTHAIAILQRFTHLMERAPLSTNTRTVHNCEIYRGIRQELDPDDFIRHKHSPSTVTHSAPAAIKPTSSTCSTYAKESKASTSITTREHTRAYPHTLARHSLQIRMPLQGTRRDQHSFRNSNHHPYKLHHKEW